MGIFTDDGSVTSYWEQQANMLRGELVALVAKLEAAERREQALAAHVEELQARFSPSPWPEEAQPDGSVIPVDPVEYFGTSETSLARLKAQCRAEALEDAQASLMLRGDDREALRLMIETTRRQAEGDRP